MSIDWRAVDFVVNGARMKLTPAEKRMVARRVAHRMLGANENHHHIPAGKLTTRMLAEQCGASEGGIQHILSKLPEAAERVCPVCGARMWVHTDGLVEPHPDSLMLQCPMSGYELPTMSAADVLALSVAWLSGWLRADPFGVPAYLSSLDRRRRDELLVAALAAVPQAHPEELFAWMAAS